MHAGLSVVVASRGYSLVVVCMGFSLRWLLLGSAGSIVVAHGLSCSWIFLDQGSNPCLLHWPRVLLVINSGKGMSRLSPLGTEGVSAYFLVGET